MVGAHRFDDEVAVFREHDGMMRFGRVLEAGIDRHRLYAMLEAGVLERLSRGLYRLTELPPLAQPDLAIVAARVPDSVVCLISALDFHEITTQVPHAVSIALNHEERRRVPAIDYPPIEVFWMSGEAYHAGVAVHPVDGTDVRVYDPEKTIADCFKYRNRIGLDVAMEALRMRHEQGELDVDALMHFARVCRVQEIIRPYLEATL